MFFQFFLKSHPIHIGVERNNKNNLKKKKISKLRMKVRKVLLIKVLAIVLSCCHGLPANNDSLIIHSNDTSVNHRQGKCKSYVQQRLSRRKEKGMQIDLEKKL